MVCEEWSFMRGYLCCSVSLSAWYVKRMVSHEVVFITGLFAGVDVALCHP